MIIVIVINCTQAVLAKQLLFLASSVCVSVRLTMQKLKKDLSQIGVSGNECVLWCHYR